MTLLREFFYTDKLRIRKTIAVLLMERVTFVDIDGDEPGAIAAFEGLIDIEERKHEEQTVIRYTGSSCPER